MECRGGSLDTTCGWDMGTPGPDSSTAGFRRPVDSRLESGNQRGKRGPATGIKSFIMNDIVKLGVATGASTLLPDFLSAVDAKHSIGLRDRVW